MHILIQKAESIDKSYRVCTKQQHLYNIKILNYLLVHVSKKYKSHLNCNEEATVVSELFLSACYLSKTD